MQGKHTEKHDKQILTAGMLLGVLKKNFEWLVIVAVLCGTLSGVCTALFVKTEYKGTSGYWVNNISGKADYIQSTMVSASSELAKNYIEIVKQRITLDRAIRVGHLDQLFPDKTHKQIVEYLSRVIETKHDKSSVHFSVIVTDQDKTRAYYITKAIQTVLPSVICEDINKKPIKGNGSVSGTATIVEPVILTDYAISMEDIEVIPPPVLRNVVLAAFGGFLIAYAIFLILMLLDTLVYDEKSLKDNFDMPVLGTIPTWNTGRSKKGRRSVLQRLMAKPNVELCHGEIVRDYEERLITGKVPFAISEAFKQLRTNVSYSKGGASTPVYVVTSTLAGAGKSIVSSNMALSFAELGKRTLIIESDMRCPTFSQIFGFDSDRRGLSEALTGIERDVDSLLIKDFYNNLHILPAGHHPPNPSELLAQNQMKEYLKEWRERYDIVIIDAPPYGEVSDAGVLADAADGYILVVRSEYSDVRGLGRTVGSLKALSAPIVGFILNDVDPKSARGAYSKSYGYGYGYGSYNTEGSVSTTRTGEEK